MWGRDVPSPLEPEIFTPAGVPACSTPVLKALAGKSGRASQRLVELGLRREASDWSDVREAAEQLARDEAHSPVALSSMDAAPWPTNNLEIQQQQQVKQARRWGRGGYGLG